MPTALDVHSVGNGAPRPGASPRLVTPEPSTVPEVHRLQVLPPAGSPGQRRGHGQRNPEHLALLKTLCRRYEQCFPSEIGDGGTKPFWHDTSLGDGSEESLFALATSFLELVDERLFPVHTELFMDELEEIWLYLDGEIPVCAMGLSYE
ncbi:MAG: hypothetical protein KDE59_18365, partial [Anaerolineales bacterium]|nr:hypothetical protein [Anaerolineales bacterium]